jgi:hypothetical protein
MLTLPVCRDGGILSRRRISQGVRQPSFEVACAASPFATRISSHGVIQSGESMHAKGIEIYCAPTADARDSWIASVRHIAVEGRCFVLSCNQFNLRRDFPADYRSVFGDDPDFGCESRREVHR